MIIPTIEQMAIFGTYDTAWEYRTFDDKHLCYIVKYINKGKKSFIPITYQNDKWVKRYFVDRNGDTLKERPLYNLHLLKLFPEKPILLVEGEKTADSAADYFPEYNVLTWMGGAGKAINVDLNYLKEKIIYLLPDNDDPGYKAMEILKACLKDNNKVYFINIKTFPLSKGWDLADLEDGEIDLDDIKLLITNSHNQKIELIKPECFPDISIKNKALNTTDNIAYLLKHYNINIRYNLMTNYAEFQNKEKKFNSINEVDCYFTEISNLCVINNVPKIDLQAHINLISERNSYHPAIEFIESKPWDGITRINDLLETIISPKQELANKLIYRWLISCVAALYLSNGIASEGALVLQGKQKIGKTYWLLKLLPLTHRHLVKEAVSLNVGNKDDIMQTTNVWIAELGEIASTFKKSDVDELKNFISSSYDEYRVPFGRFSRKCPRRTIFYGSVNQQYFLADDTGNRRYWTIPATEINYEHNIDMQQLWAEIKIIYDNGESYRLTNEEQDLLNVSNIDHECINPLEEMILNNFHWDSQSRRDMTCSDILLELDLSIDQSKINKLANTLRKLGINNKRTKQTTVFSLPHRKSPHHH